MTDPRTAKFTRKDMAIIRDAVAHWISVVEGLDECTDADVAEVYAVLGKVESRLRAVSRG